MKGFRLTFVVLPNYQVIFKVSYVFRSLLNLCILHLKTLIGLFECIHGQASYLNLLGVLEGFYVEAIVTLFTFAEMFNLRTTAALSSNPKLTLDRI